MTVDQEIELNRKSRAAVVQVLHRAFLAAGKTGRMATGNDIACPFHDDHKPSGSIYRGKDGAYRFYCHGCKTNYGDYYEILAKIEGTTAAEILSDLRQRENPSEPQQRRYKTLEDVISCVEKLKHVRTVERVYAYQDPDTQAVDLAVIRVRDDRGGKSFLQVKPHPRGGFVFGKPEGPLPLYNRSAIRDAGTVIVVEGEKAADLGASLEMGLAFTTSPMGAGVSKDGAKSKAQQADWSILAGKIVYLWPDNDADGFAHMRAVVRILRALPSPPAEIRFIDPKKMNLPEKGDIEQVIQAHGGDLAAAREAVGIGMAESVIVPIAADFRKRLNDAKTGRIRTVPFTQRILTGATKALRPGTVTCFCAEPGFGKSSLVLDWLIHWNIRLKIRADCLMMEESRAYHLHRALAIMEQRIELQDTDWCSAHPDDVEAAYQRRASDLDKLAGRIDAGEEMFPRGAEHGDVLDWVERQAAAGARVVVVDPVTAIVVDDARRQASEDKRFVLSLKSLMARYEASAILFTHPRLSTDGSNPLTGMSGGMAYPNFSQNVIWGECPEKEKVYQLEDASGNPLSGSANRIFRIGKCRNGRGRRWKIANNFNPQSMTFDEIGRIVSEMRDSEVEII